jgi:thiamine phosphate synthase YjbQ (UPF0047 family)
MSWFQKEIKLNSQRRGCHLITSEILGQLPELKNYKVGLANIFSKLMSILLLLFINYCLSSAY